MFKQWRAQLSLSVTMACVTIGVLLTNTTYGEEFKADSQELIESVTESNDFLDLSGIEDDDNMEKMDLDNDISNQSGSNAHPGLWRNLAGDDANFVYSHELSYIASSPSRVETNRSSLRLKWKRFFGKWFYLGFDGKSIFHFGNDNQTPNDKTVDVGSNIKELFVQASWGKNSLSVGKQVVVWGESETATVTDVFSPRNLTDFVFTSLDESRIGQYMIKYERHSELGRWTLLINPDVEVNEQPDALELQSNQFSGNDLSNDIDDYEYGLHWKKPIGNGDYSLMLAKLIDNQGVYFYRGQQGNSILADKQYRQYDMFGAAANLNFGSIGLELEAAYNNEFPIQTKEPYSTTNLGVATRDQLLLGTTLKYNLNNVSELTFGAAHTHIFDDVSGLDVIDNGVWDFLFGWSDKYIYETLTLSYVYQHQLKTNSKIHKLTTRYAFTDNVFGNFDVFMLDGLGADTTFQQDSAYLRFEYHF